MGQKILRFYKQLDSGLHMEICQQRHSYIVNLSNKMHNCCKERMFSASFLISVFYKLMTAIRHVAASCEVQAL